VVHPLACPDCGEMYVAAVREAHMYHYAGGPRDGYPETMGIVYYAVCDEHGERRVDARKWRALVSHVEERNRTMYHGEVNWLGTDQGYEKYTGEWP